MLALSFIAFVGSLVPGVPGSATGPELEPVCRDLTTQLDTILASPVFEGARLGILVQNLENGELLYASHPDEQLVPASNIKIVSTAAALHFLGTDHRFLTDVYGEVDENGVVNGDLYIRGAGDPWLLPERVWYLSNRLYYLGVRQIRGDIVADDSFFDGPRFASGQEQDTTSYSYMAPRGALSVGFNAVLVHINPAQAPGQPAEVLIEPQSSYAKVESQVVTVSRGRTRLNVDVLPDGDRSVIKVSGRISIREPGHAYYRRIDNPPIFAGEVLRHALKQVGVAVDEGKVRTGVVPEGTSKIAQLASPRLADLVSRVNKHSNNFMAEQVALVTGAELYGPPGNWQKAQTAIELFLNDVIGLDPSSYTVRNASGLHDVNQISPRQLVQVLAYMYNQPQMRPEFVASMAVAGNAGTLSTRMLDSEAAGVLRAKTGTLSIASALSGYVTAKRGQVLAFSLVVNDYTTAISEIWAAQDEVGTALATLDTRCTHERRPFAVQNRRAITPPVPAAEGGTSPVGDVEVALP